MIEGLSEKDELELRINFLALSLYGGLFILGLGVVLAGAVAGFVGLLIEFLTDIPMSKSYGLLFTFGSVTVLGFVVQKTWKPSLKRCAHPHHGPLDDVPWSSIGERGVTAFLLLFGLFAALYYFFMVNVTGSGAERQAWPIIFGIFLGAALIFSFCFLISRFYLSRKISTESLLGLIVHSVFLYLVIKTYFET